MAHLENAAINLTALRESARMELVQILDSMKGGAKALVLDETLSGPLGLVAEPKLLKEHGIEDIFHLTEAPLDTRCTSVLYLCRPQPRLMAMVAAHIRENALRRQQKEYLVYFCPRRTLLCERELATGGVFGDVTTGEFRLDLIPFERDVLSLETPMSFRETFGDGDPSSLYHVASALMKLQSLFGLVPRVAGKGVNAQRVFKLMRRMRMEMPAAHFAGIVPEVHQLVLIDRRVDMVTPMLVQRTYEGLLDELIGIRNGMTDFDGRKVPLNSADTIFAELRDTPFRALGPILHRKASEIKSTYSGKDQAKTVSEMAAFMKEFKSAHQEHSYLQLHIAMAERLSETTKTAKHARRTEIEHNMLAGEEQDACEQYVESAIDRRDPVRDVVRLMCLESLTRGGLKPKRYDALRHAFVQSYGFEHMFTLATLARLGLFAPATGSRGTWPTLRKQLRLVVPPQDAAAAASRDYSALYEGYAPLSARLVEAAQGAGGWSQIEEVTRLLPGGDSFDFRQELPASVEERARIAERDGSRNKKPLTLVFFLGGVTHAEISAFRHLSEKENHGVDYIVASTQLVNGASLVDQVIERLESKLQLRGAAGAGAGKQR